MSARGRAFGSRTTSDRPGPSRSRADQAFVYTTATVGFSRPAIALALVPPLAPLTPEVMLTGTLEQLLRPIAAAGKTRDALLRIAAACRYEAHGPLGDTIPVSAQVLIAENLDLGDDPGTIARAIADAIADWRLHDPNALSCRLIALVLTITAPIDDQRPALVRFEEIPIPVSAVASDWWQ